MDRYALLAARYPRRTKTHLRYGRGATNGARCGQTTARQPLKLSDDLGAVTCEACRALALTGANRTHGR